MCCSAANADLVASYDMTTLNVSGQQSTSPNVATASNVTVGGFVENLTGGTAQGEFGVRNTGLITLTDVNGYSARSLNNLPSNPWWEFTVTPSSGFQMVFDRIQLDAGVTNNLGNAQDWDYDVRWSVDGFSSLIGTIDGPALSGSGTATGTNLTLDLSSLSAQSSAFSIRILPNRITGTNGATSQRAGWVDNVQLHGTISAVPEPSSVALVGMAMVGCACRRRRSA